MSGPLEGSIILLPYRKRNLFSYFGLCVRVYKKFTVKVDFWVKVDFCN